MNKELEKKLLNAKKGELEYKDYLQAFREELQESGFDEKVIQEIIDENEKDIRGCFEHTDIDEKTHSTYYSSVLDIAGWMPQL